jgi:hypothetical protein
MRQRILRRLEALEKEYVSREKRELSSLGDALVYIWTIVLAYHLGDLKSDEEDPREAEARALKYPSRDEYSEALFKVIKDIKDISEIYERYNDAYRRLFAKVGLEFDDTPRKVLFDAFVTMVDQLPDRWLRWLRSNLQQWCRDAEIAVGSNLPRRLSPDNLFPWSQKDQAGTRIRLKR